MTESIENKLVGLTQKLLDCIAGGDWEAYVELCDPSLTCFEPEACGHLVEGMEFHKFYFDNLSFRSPSNTTVTAPHVRLLGKDVGVVSYVRLTQKMDGGGASTTSFEETRIWQKTKDGWKHVHFHRSTQTTSV